MFPTFWKIPASGMKTNKPNIRIVAASVTGAMHRHKDLPCQDCFGHAHGKNLVAIVSDGAGSAKYGKIGAKTVCTTLCDLLKNSSFKDIENNISRAIAVTRQKLMRHRLNKGKNEAGLADFAATIVGMVYHQNRGIFFHIGDGAAIALQDDEGHKFIASRPENGNFSCETFFFTQMAWAENLRFTNFESASSIFLMSDGLTNFSFTRDYQDIEKNFILPINSFLKDEKVKNKATRALTNTLNMPKAQKLNPDDKTLVWAMIQ